MSVDGNVWYVKLADGDVERFSLDELDEAFQNGHIDEGSMVLGAGSETWMKLADLLGGSDEPSAPVAAAPAVVPPPLPGAFPVIAQRAAAPAPAMQAAMLRPPVAMPVVPMASSLRPVSVDLSRQLLLEEPEFRPSSKKRWAVGLLATMAIAGAGAFLALRQTSASAASDPVPAFAAAAAALPPPTPVTPVVAAPPSPPPVAQAATGPSPVMDPTQRLNDDQRQKLTEADKKTKGKAKTRSGGGGGTSGGSHAPTKDKSSGFTTSGNKFDPLNSSL